MGNEVAEHNNRQRIIQESSTDNHKLQLSLYLLGAGLFECKMKSETKINK